MVNVLFIDYPNAAQYRKPECSGKNTLSFLLKIPGESIYRPFNGVLEKMSCAAAKASWLSLVSNELSYKFRKIIFHLKLNYD